MGKIKSIISQISVSPDILQEIRVEVNEILKN